MICSMSRFHIFMVYKTKKRSKIKNQTVTRLAVVGQHHEGLCYISIFYSQENFGFYISTPEVFV